MKVVKLDTQEAPNKWWAAQDARIRNYANSTRYSDSQRVTAERMKLALELVYCAKGIYIAYGKKGISIKVDRGVVVRRKDLKLLEDDWNRTGIVKKVSNQGVIYRLNVA